MTDLLQRLKEMSREKFELFVHSFLRAKYPTANVQKVDGSGGDEGIDSFAGELAKGPAVWQAKHFVNGIGPRQKRNIVESLKVALAARQLSYWTLCVPVDLTVKEHSWFQEERNKNSGRVAISLIQASNLVEEVSRNFELRNAFFEDTLISNALRARAVLLNAEGKTVEALLQALEEQRQLIVERYARLDPRLIPEVTIGPGAVNIDKSSGIVMSKFNGSARIDFRVRNPLEYLVDPIKARFSISKELAEQFERALDKGVPITFPMGSVSSFSATSPILAEIEALASGPEIRVVPNIPSHLANLALPVKLVAGNDNSFVLPFFDLRITRYGRQEVEFTSLQQTPVQARLEVIRERPDQQSWTVKAHLQLSLLGADIREASRAIRFVEEVDAINSFKIFPLEDSSLSPWIISGLHGKTAFDPEFVRIIHMAATVSEHFKVPIALPRAISDEDLDSLEMLHRIATGETFEVNSWEANLIKEGSLRGAVAQLNQNGYFNFIMGQRAEWRSFNLMGVSIAVGPIGLSLNKCGLESPSEFYKKYDEAAEGAPVALRLRVEGLCRFLTSDDLKNMPLEEGYGNVGFEKLDLP